MGISLSRGLHAPLRLLPPCALVARPPAWQCTAPFLHWHGQALQCASWPMPWPAPDVLPPPPPTNHPTPHHPCLQRRAYKISSWTSTDEFLTQLAHKAGKLLKGATHACRRCAAPPARTCQCSSSSSLQCRALVAPPTLIADAPNTLTPLPHCCCPAPPQAASPTSTPPPA